MADPILITALTEIDDLTGDIQLLAVDNDEATAATKTRLAAIAKFNAKYLQVANNLSDVTAATARTNLGLGTIAVIDDAASDGTIYGRQNGAWVDAGGGSSLPVVDETAMVYKTGTEANTLTFDVDAYTAARVVTWPDAAMTVAGLEVENEFTAKQTIQAGLTQLQVIASSGSVGVNLKATDKSASIQFINNFDEGVEQAWVFGTLASDAFKIKDNTAGTTPVNIQDGAATSALRIDGDGFVGLGTFSPATQLHVYHNSATTNAIVNVQTTGLNTTGTGAAGLGVGSLYTIESSTTADQSAGRLLWKWATATHATRAAKGALTAYYTDTEREAFTWAADSTGVDIALLGDVAISDKTDPTKTITMDVSGVSTGTNRSITWPDAAMTVAGLEVANVFTAAQTINAGAATALTIAQSGAGFKTVIDAENSGDPGTGATRLRVANSESAFLLQAYGSTAPGVLASAASIYAQDGSRLLLGAKQNSVQVFTNDRFQDPTLSVTAGGLGIFDDSPTSRLEVLQSDAAQAWPVARFTQKNAAFPAVDILSSEDFTSTISDILRLRHATSGTPAAGFGVGFAVELQSSTTADQSAGRLTYEWVTATHATRKALGKLTVYDTAEREAIRWEASGTAAMLGFYGATAVAQPAHIVDADGSLADITTKFNQLLADLASQGLQASS